jgi:hypothetical protein
MNNNIENSNTNFLNKLEKENIRSLGGSSDTIVLCAYIEDEDEYKKKNEDEKITYFSFNNHRSKSCAIL